MLKWSRRSLAVGITLFLVTMVVLGYWFKWDMAGFIGGYSKVTIERSGKETKITTELPQGKSLWDWLNLLGVLAIPAAVGFGTVWFTAQQGKASDAANKQQHQTELEIASDNQCEVALQAYINAMSELLLDRGLLSSSEFDHVRYVARVQTLTVLHILDGRRKSDVLQFLETIPNVV